MYVYNWLSFRVRFFKFLLLLNSEKTKICLKFNLKMKRKPISLFTRCYFYV